MIKLSNEMKNKKLFLLDIDGTIGFDASLFDGAMEFFEEVKKKNGKYIFITNNSTKSIADYVDKFLTMGVAVDKSNFVTSSYATALYLKKQYSDKLLFVVGTESFVRELKGFGLSVTEKIEDEIAAVVVGFDNELNYEKVRNACELLETRTLDYIATNPDKVCPTNEKTILVDCGSICKCLESATGRTPDITLGKPDPNMLVGIQQQKNLKPEQIAMVGDRIYTDIAMAHNANAFGCLVLSGETTLEVAKAAPRQPDLIAENIKELGDLLEESHQ